MSALVGFLVGSGLYGTAWDLNSLIAFRVLTAVPGSIVPVLTMVTVIAGLIPSQAMADANAFLLGPRTCQSKGFT